MGRRRKRRNSGFVFHLEVSNQDSAAIHAMRKPNETAEQAALGALRAGYKRIARDRLNNAISRGEIGRPDECQGCGKKGATTAHHTDYAQPFAVKWLCGRCHEKAHKDAKVWGMVR